MMLERFELIVFDWDGTLIDSTPTIARSIQAAAADLGLKVPDYELACHVIGLGLSDALALAVPDLTEARMAEYSARYRHHYLAAEDAFDLFAGAKELIEALRSCSVPIAIATGKSRGGLQRALRLAGMEKDFAATRCADQTHPKPHPAMLLELAEELTVEVERALMVGDTTHDLQMANAAGASAVGMTHGAHSAENLEALAPLALFDSLSELHAWLMPVR
jgi:phosphoglycolate phosphatase